MIFTIYTDGDSGLIIDNKKILPFYENSQEYIINIPIFKIDKFIEEFYLSKFGLTDKVYNAIEPIFEDVIYLLKNNLEDKIENGNYYIKINKYININIFN